VKPDLMGGSTNGYWGRYDIPLIFDPSLTKGEYTLEVKTKLSNDTYHQDHTIALGALRVALPPPAQPPAPPPEATPAPSSSPVIPPRVAPQKSGCACQFSDVDAGAPGSGIALALAIGAILRRRHSVNRTANRN
jgi:MYXO-CTERM domain-containing protein